MENNNTNIQNQGGDIVHNSQQKFDYYTTTSKKIGDFLLGFFGIIILNTIFSTVVFSLFLSASWNYSVYIFLSIIILILLIVIFFKIGRRFVAIGIISVALIPILVFGSCLLILSGIGF